MAKYRKLSTIIKNPAGEATKLPPLNIPMPTPIKPLRMSEIPTTPAIDPAMANLSAIDQFRHLSKIMRKQK